MNIRLFELIKSLTPEEKRYFKLSAKYGQEKNYLKVFNIIDKQTVYDEKEIRKKYAAESWVKNFSATKNYLYELILKNLETGNSKTSFKRVILSGLAQIEILFQKALYEQASTLLEKLLSKEETKQNLSLLPILQLWKLQIALNSPNLSEKTLSWLNQATKDYIQASKDSLSAAQAYRYQTFMSYIQTQTAPLAKNCQLKKIEKVYLRLQKEPACLLPITQAIRLYTALAASFILRNKAYSKTALAKFFLFLEENIQFKNSQPAMSVSILVNATYYYLSMQAFEEAETTFTQLNQLEINKEQESPYLSSLLESSKIWLRLYQSLQKVEQNSPDLQLMADEALLYVQKNTRIPERSAIMIQYFAGAVCMLHHQYEQAFKYWEVFWGQFIPNFKYFQAHALLLRGLVLVANKSFELLPYAVGSCGRFLKKIKAYRGFGKAILQFLNLAVKEPTKKPDWGYLLEQIRQQYETSRLSPIQFFPYLDWVEQQIQKS